MRRGDRRSWLVIVLLICWLGAGLVRPIQAEPAKPRKAVPAGAVKDQAKEEEEDYEMQRVLVDTIDQVQRNYVREVSRRKLIRAAIKGILSELDPYSTYIGPEEMTRFRSTLESEFGGIGIHIAMDGKKLKVLSPMVGTPAYRAGLVAGDTIVEVNGKSTADWTIEDAVRRVKGAPGTQVSLTVVHPGSPARVTVKITREMIHVDTVLGDHRKPDDHWDFMLDPQKKIGYIRVTAFSRETPKDLRRALEELKREKLRGLVLDLRFNPGGLLTSAIQVCNLFISKGRIVSTAGRNSPERIWDAHNHDAFEGFPMAILVNGYSASASEIVSACLQDNKRAVIVGERTWGKGSVQNVIPLDDGAGEKEGARSGGDFEPHSALKLTIAGYHRPSGKNIDRFPGAKQSDVWGVLPDPGYEVKLTDAERAALVKQQWQRDVLAPKKPGHAGPASPTLKPGATPSAAASKDAGKTAAKPAAGGKKAAPPVEKKAVSPIDRQLQKALDYLHTELARAK